MKKLTNIILAMLAAMPMIASAQWSAVRFDHVNTFQKVHAATATNAFVLGNENVAYEGFLMRTNNGGETWDSIALNTTSDAYQLTELFFVDAYNGFTGGLKNNTNQVLMKSTDNASTWTQITPDTSSVDPVSSVFFLNASQGFATSASNLYTTANGGTNWTTSALAFIPSDLHFIDSNIGFAAGSNPIDNTAVVMKTIDGGVNWTESMSAVDANFFVNNCEAVQAVNADLVFALYQWSNKLYRTVDGGTTWNTIVCDSVFQIIDFYFSSPDSGHVLSAYGQLYQTNDGGITWSLEYATEWGFYGPSIYLNSLSYADGIGYMCGSDGLIKRSDVAHNGTIDHIIKTGSLNIFPNPSLAVQNLTIQTNGMSGDCSLVIMNSIGQIVFEENIDDLRNDELLNVSTMNLKSGIYCIALSNNNQKQIANIVISE